MTVTASASEARSRPVQLWLVAWACALAAVLAVFLLQDRLPWAVNYPASAIIPVADWVSALMSLIKSNFSWLTRSITAALGVPLDFALDLLAKNFKIGHGAEMLVLPRLSWVGVCIAAFLAGRAAGGWKLGALVGGCFLYIALFGQWTSAMLTLGLISIAVPFCIVTGLFVGIWAWRKPWAERLLISPALDLMQTIPTFAYLIPMLLLFGNSPVSAMIATAIFATPPMVRATMLGLSRVPSEIDDFSEMAGCTARQKLWRVLLPSARPTLMVGVNQVIMLALNMVIIASMIGAGGLGYDVLLALRALKVGEAMEAGLAIVALAIALDRLSQAIARNHAKGHVYQEVSPSFWRRYPNLTLAVAILAATTLLGLFVPAFAAVPKAITFTTAPHVEDSGELDHDQLLRHDRSVPRGADPQCAEPGARLLRGLPVAGRGVPARPCRLPARRPAPRRPGRGADRLLRGDRPLGKDHGDGLPLRHLGLHRLPDRHSDRADGIAQRPCREDRHARSSTRCRCCRRSASSSRW